MQQSETDNFVSPEYSVENNDHWTPERISVVLRNVLIVLGAGVSLGVFAATSNLYYVAATIAAAVLVILVAWQFEAALTVYVLVAFIPWGQTPSLAVGGSGVGKGLYVSEIMLGFLLVVWVGRYLLGSLPKNRIPSGFYIPVVLYISYCIINVVHCYLFWDLHVSKDHQHLSVNIIELGIRILSVGAMAMMATSITSRLWLKRMAIALVLAGGYNAINALTGYRVPFQAPWWPLIALLPAGYCFAVAIDGGHSVWKRGLCTVAVGALLFVVLYKSISWVSGWIGLLATFGTVALIHSRKIFVAAVLACLLVVLLAWPFFFTNVVVASQEEGDYDRFSLLAGGWKYATNFPLGVGLGNYRTYNAFYYGEKWGTTSYTSAHGTYAQALSETGIPGFVLLLSILIGGGRWLLVSYRRLDPGPTKTLILAVLGQTTGIAVAAFIGDYIFPAYHNGGLVTFSATVYSWLSWGLAIAAIRLQGESSGSVNIDC